MPIADPDLPLSARDLAKRATSVPIGGQDMAIRARHLQESATYVPIGAQDRPIIRRQMLPNAPQVPIRARQVLNPLIRGWRMYAPGRWRLCSPVVE